MIPSRLKPTTYNIKRYGEGDNSSPYPSSYGSGNIFSGMRVVTLLSSECRIEPGQKVTLAPPQLKYRISRSKGSYTGNVQDNVMG